MRRVRPGVAAARGSTGTGGAGAVSSRAPGEERALTSVAAGERYRAERSGERQGAQRSGERHGAERSEGPEGTGPADAPRLWHVTLSVSGEEAPLGELRRALEQLAHDHPFLLTSRYAPDHAEIRYWEEARDLHDAAAVALRLWGEHRQTAGLPPWEIVGLEVIDRQTYHQRIAEGYGPAPASPVGVHPF